MNKPYAVRLYTTAHVELLVDARDIEEAVTEARRLATLPTTYKESWKHHPIGSVTCRVGCLV